MILIRGEKGHGTRKEKEGRVKNEGERKKEEEKEEDKRDK